MLTLPPAVRLSIGTAPCDLRKPVDGIALLVEQTLRLDPRSGHLLVVFNRRGDQVRILFWDRQGYCLFAEVPVGERRVGDGGGTGGEHRGRDGGEAGKEFKDWTIAKGYDDGWVGTAPVGTYPARASPYGAADMVGNVWEWVEDEREGGQVVRGGSWDFVPRLARASSRSWPGPENRGGGVGVRCAQELLFCISGSWASGLPRLVV